MSYTYRKKQLTGLEHELLEAFIADFDRGGGTSVDYEILVHFVNLGLLECSHFNVLEKAREVVANGGIFVDDVE